MVPHEPFRKMQPPWTVQGVRGAVCAEDKWTIESFIQLLRFMLGKSHIQ